MSQHDSFTQEMEKHILKNLPMIPKCKTHTNLWLVVFITLTNRSRNNVVKLSLQM